MELLRRVGGGRLSEIFGEDLIETDRFLRTVGINEVAERSAQKYLSENNQPFQKAAHAYLKGINAFVNQGPTPPEFDILGIPKQEFTPVDIFRSVGYIGFNFNTAVRNDPLMTTILTKLGPEYFQDLVINTVAENTTIPTYIQDTTSISNITDVAMSVLNALPVPEWLGSNSWVVSGAKSQSGLPLFANDAHIGFSQPSVWYEAHLNSPGFNFYGNHLAGFPFGLIGHNDFSAWGLTIFPNDDMDFYQERVNPEDDRAVWDKDHWEPLKTRREVIKVKDGEDFSFDVLSSKHGPILNEVNDAIDSIAVQPVSFFWTFAKFPCKALQTAYGMAHSKSLEEFESAISQLEAPGLNMTYADRAGNIAWWAVARLLKRPNHVEPKLILDGASGNDDPIGWYPFAENPKSINPPEGFVYSANNQPDSARGILHPGYYYPGLRGERIMDLLSAKDDWDLESFQKMIMDDTSPLFPSTAKQVTQLLTLDLTDMEAKVVELISNWDGAHGLEDTGPTIYYHLLNQLQMNMMKDELGTVNYRIFTTTLIARRSLVAMIDNQESIWWDNVNTPEIENREQIVNLSFRETVEDLAEQLGTDTDAWTWGKVHLLEHVHPIGRQKPMNHLFNVGPFPMSGGDEVINKMDFNKTATPYMIRSGPSMRILIDLADMENSLSVIPTGQSGHLLSPHYQDQVEFYNTGRFRPQHMDKQRITSEATRALILKP